MPFLTRDLPPGGRHIDRIVPPSAPVPAAATRLRQLLPVGLLVAASSAGVALSPMLGGSSAVADASHHDAAVADSARTALGSGQVVASRQIVSRDSLARASYVLPQAGRHRATDTVEQPGTATDAITGAITGDAAATGGRHRASGPASTTPAAHQTAAPKHAATSTPAASATQAAQPTTAAKSAAATGSATTTTPASTPASPAPTTSATQQSDVVTSTVDGVGQLVGGVLGTVGGLLGGS